MRAARTRARWPSSSTRRSPASWSCRTTSSSIPATTAGRCAAAASPATRSRRSASSGATTGRSGMSRRRTSPTPYSRTCPPCRRTRRRSWRPTGPEQPFRARRLALPVAAPDGEPLLQGVQLGAVLGACGDEIGPALGDVAVLAALGDGGHGLAVVLGDRVHLAPDAVAPERHGLVADDLRLERDRPGADVDRQHDAVADHERELADERDAVLRDVGQAGDEAGAGLEPARVEHDDVGPVGAAGALRAAVTRLVLDRDDRQVKQRLVTRLEIGLLDLERHVEPAAPGVAEGA